MSRIYKFILMMSLAAGFAACEDEDCNRLHVDTEMMGIPSVLKGSFPVGKLTRSVGDSVVFAPRLMDTTGVKYSWMLNGKEVSTDTVFVYRVEKPCRAKVSCTLENPKGKVTISSAIATDVEPGKGILVVDSKGIGWYDEATGILYGDVYSSMNYGEGLRLGSYDDLCVASSNGKLYMTVSTSTSNIEHLFVADRNTLEAGNSAIIDANIDAFFLLDGKQALVAGGGISRIDLGSLAKTRLLKKYNWGIYNALAFNGKLLANTTDSGLEKLSYYDVAALLRAKENEMPEAVVLDVWQDGKVNFVAASDGNAYTLGCNEEGSEYYLVRIGGDLKFEKTVLPFKPLISTYSNGLYTAGLSLDKGGKAIYIPAGDGSIYKYALGDPSSLASPFVPALAGKNAVCGAGVNVNPANGEIWVCYTETIDREEHGKIVVYDAAGKQTKSIDLGESIPQAVLFP